MQCRRIDVPEWYRAPSRILTWPTVLLTNNMLSLIVGYNVSCAHIQTIRFTRSIAHQVGCHPFVVAPHPSFGPHKRIRPDFVLPYTLGAQSMTVGSVKVSSRSVNYTSQLAFFRYFCPGDGRGCFELIPFRSSAVLSQCRISRHIVREHSDDSSHQKESTENQT